MRILLMLTIVLSTLNSTQGQIIRTLTFNRMIREVSSRQDTLVVLNFWATWCKPCIEELPWFDKAGREHAEQRVKMILVNLDFNSKVGSVAEPFVRKNNFSSEVWHLSDTDPNEWIDRIDSSWSGAIPATVMFRNGKKVFFREGQVSSSELNELLAKLNSN